MVGIRVTRGSTGRQDGWQTDDPDDPGNQVHILFAMLDAAQTGADVGGGFSRRTRSRMAARAKDGILDELRAIERHAARGPLFRGRVAAPDTTPASFGPPPAPQPKGRFNAEGQRALYVSRSPSVLQAELSQNGPIEGYWYVEFGLPEHQLEVLRLEPAALVQSPRLNQFVLLAEFQRSPHLQDPHTATNYLRSVCDVVGIDGIEYPTVTGSYASDSEALNLVLISEQGIDLVLVEQSDAEPIYAPATTEP